MNLKLYTEISGVTLTKVIGVGVFFTDGDGLLTKNVRGVSCCKQQPSIVHAPTGKTPSAR